MALAQLESVNYEVTVGTTGTALVPVAISVTSYQSLAARTISVACTVPRWLRVGMTVVISGETATKIMNKAFKVKAIDPDLASSEPGIFAPFGGIASFGFTRSTRTPSS